VALNWTEDQTDPQYEIVMDAYETLSTSVDARGRTIEIHKIHQPGPFYLSEEESEATDIVEGTIPREEGDRLSASYINFYIANRGVVVPTFNDPYDLNALETLQRLFNDRTIVGVPSRDILPGGGNIHCIVQQQPNGKIARKDTV
jgi:agmatine deiminase